MNKDRKNLLIIGNGFDLAHGLKTKYKSFIKDYLINKMLNNGVIEPKQPKNYFNHLTIKPSHLTNNKTLFTKNKFLSSLINQIELNNWVDIEELYFKSLNEENCDIIKLNNDFLVIQTELENYLNSLKISEPNSCLFSFFHAFSIKTNKEIMALNFNYTNIFELKYKHLLSNCKVVNIHGQLNNDNNPIVFGYAPTDKQTMELINDKGGNNEYLKNIKRYYYKRTNSEIQLNEFLDDDDRSPIHVHILGHSCGTSDRNILKTIFLNKNVKKISIMYHNDYNNYFDVLVNIDRVVEDNTQFGIIENFYNSIRMPQFDDSPELALQSQEMIDHFKGNKTRRKLILESSND